MDNETKCKHRWEYGVDRSIRYCPNCDTLHKSVFPGYDNLDKEIWEDISKPIKYK